MRVFVTGGSGFIGSAVVPELLAAGHEVVGLARSDASAAALAAAGAEVRRGDLDDLDSLRAGGRGLRRRRPPRLHPRLLQRRGLRRSAQADRVAVEALGDALAGSDRPLVIASGTARSRAERAHGDRDGRARPRRRRLRARPPSAT